MSAETPDTTPAPAEPFRRRLIRTLLYGKNVDRNVKRGLATLCIGGGEAVAMVVER